MTEFSVKAPKILDKAFISAFPVRHLSSIIHILLYSQPIFRPLRFYMYPRAMERSTF